MRFRSKAYWKDRAQMLERENDQWVEKSGIETMPYLTQKEN